VRGGKNPATEGELDAARVLRFRPRRRKGRTIGLASLLHPDEGKKKKGDGGGGILFVLV